MQYRREKLSGGFTLIELLTVVAIIALLISIFSVGVKKVRIISFGLQQKSVFHAMTVGLELFSGDFDSYPDSRITQNSGGTVITGAQHLAEALLGRDERGFERLTRWTPPDDDTPAKDLYSNLPASLARRKGPYCEIKYGKVLTIRDLWEGANGQSTIIYDTPGPVGPASYVARSPVITDVFNRSDSPVGRIGNPILYFKADTSKRFRVDSTRQTVPDASYVEAQYNEWTYNFNDNLPILQLPWLRDTAMNGMDVHYQDYDNQGRNQARMFYEQITQTTDPDRNFFKPYNNTGFILISAGWDSIFGTKDDIVNFD